ncbi:hypothetical protein KUC_3302 [Vreelandella boliviensis LC1]|uniref:Uncharacterized protein n=1 Tax=Vreelandella boliviensis LC1 TaxID=1072583 RepID=A0A7U9BYM5_9GAMM|nr:hypothetical protein KUC_3302 [Halomonas boliviensis LC1]
MKCLGDEAADLGWDKNVWEDNGDGHQPQDARFLQCYPCYAYHMVHGH